MPARSRFSARDLRLLFVLVSAAAAGSCGGGGDVGPPDEAVATVEVTPTILSLAAGQTSQLTATVRAADGTALTGRTVTWATSDAAIATIGESGIVTAVAPGQVQVTATSEGKTGAAAITVTVEPVATVEVSPSPASVAVGRTGQLVAVPKSAAGAELVGRLVAWTTADPAIATVSETGVVTGVAVGEVTITATSEGRSGSTQLTVSATPVATVTVTPTTSSIAERTTVPLTATVRDAGGTVLTGRPVTWTTSAGTVATVSATGLVTGVAAGTATITATSEGVNGQTIVTVTAAVGVVRTWRGGASGSATDWAVAANWSPAGTPTPLDTARVPVTTNSPVLTGNVQIARLIVAGGRLRTAGYSLGIRAR